MLKIALKKTLEISLFSSVSLDLFDFGSYPLAALQMTDLPSLFCVCF